ncbi:MAG: M48 family metallopeptidase [Gammaproteobacteria bacterium]
MKYTPAQPPEGINVAVEHPLKSFFILTAGTIGIIIITVLALGLAADYLVKYIPVEYEQSLFSEDGVYLMPFATDDSDEGIQVKQYVQNLVDQLHSASGESFSDHHFLVEIANTNDVNAFAVPGGHIVVTKGLFSSIESENGLSMILAHEMAHHYERHPLRSTGRGLVVSLFLLTILGADGSSFLQGFIGNTASITNLAFSRQQETDSDNFASKLLIKFYGHASGAAEFFEYINSEESVIDDIPSFLSTHPATENRISDLVEIEKDYSGVKKPLPAFLNDYIQNNQENEHF